jgi:predicted DNA-binding transcriptional regulator AlpA
MDARFINREHPKMRRRLRYSDLVALGIVANRVTLSAWIKKRGFPPGQLTGPNTRTWDEAEVQAWLDRRPTEPKAIPQVEGKRRGRPRKAEQHSAQA